MSKNLYTNDTNIHAVAFTDIEVGPNDIDSDITRIVLRTDEPGGWSPSRSTVTLYIDEVSSVQELRDALDTYLAARSVETATVSA